MSSQSALHYEQGKLCYQNKKFQEAIFQFTEAIRLKPESPQAAARCYNARGVVYFYLGEFKNVIKDCAKALELDPNNANYHNCRGNAYFSLGKFHKAAEDFSKAIELSPEASHGRYYNNRGSAYRRLKQFKEAIEDYTAAIAVDSKNGNYYNNRGNTYFDMGEFQLAIDDFTTALGLEPYSPKTRLTLAQAHEALAQEKRMKNATQFQGIFSSVKSKKHKGKVQVIRKERASGIYVSPAGVEVTFIKGSFPFKKKCQRSFQWSEDMKIELMNESNVKLYLDGTRNTWVVITPCEAANVEEELIGRITTKFASYSTACLVAQHEGVCNEYTDIIRGISAAQEHLNLLESVLAEANKQKDQYVKQEKFELAQKSQTQAQKLEDQIKQKKLFIESESTRAEGVRAKAEAEAGPVLDMVQIMQNRVQELFHTRVKSVKDKYKVDDLELEEQLQKMSALVQRAKELAALVARPVNDIRKAINAAANKGDDSDEEEEHDKDKSWANFEKPAATPAPAPATPASPTAESAAAATEAPAPAAAPEPTHEVHVQRSNSDQSLTSDSHHHDHDESEESDWDNIDDSALPEAFAPLEGAEVFMTVEPSTGMVTITPSRSAHELPPDLPKAPLGDMVMIRKTSLAAIQTTQKEKEAQLSELAQKAALADTVMEEKAALAEEVESTHKSLSMIKAELEALRSRAEDTESKLQAKDQSESDDVHQKEVELSNIRAEMALLRQQQAQAEAQLAEKDNLVATLKHTTESLEAMKSEAERVKQQLAEKIAEQEKGKSDLHSQLSLTESQKSELERQAAEQAAAVEELKAHLNHVNRDLGNAARDALEKSARLKELEQHEVIMAQALEDAKKQTDEERQRALELKIQMESQLAEIESTSRNLLDDLAKTKQEKEELHKTVEMQSMTLSELRRHLAAVQADLERANADQMRKTQELEEVKQKTESDRALIENLKEQSRVEELKRRELHNIIQEIKGNIRVYIRIRPSLKAEEANDIRVYERVIGSDDRGLQVTGGEEESATGKGSITKKWNFEFDRVFFPDNSQETIFKEISQLVQSALDGYKVCIFAYGQTGSGKTFTMEGPPAPCSETDRGMIPRSVEQIFSYAGEMRKKGWEYKFSVSFLEIYLQTIRDLLQVESEDVSENKHEIRMVKKGKENVTEVAGLNVVDVTSAEELVPLLKQANSQRATSATASNSRSSRSHSVFTLRISGVHRESGQQSEGVLNLIDLAGSERIAKSEVTGIRLEEAKAINTSLTCLGDVIAALAQGAKHVPFRNSKLTYLLQDCFGGGSKTLMFINIAPESRHMPESLCSLRFGAKVHDCHIGTAKKAVSAVDSGAAPKAAGKVATPAKKK